MLLAFFVMFGGLSLFVITIGGLVIAILRYNVITGLKLAA